MFSQNVRFKTKDTRYEIKDTQYDIKDTQYKIRDAIRNHNAYTSTAIRATPGPATMAAHREAYLKHRGSTQSGQQLNRLRDRVQEA